jgi:hypothetical protein
MGLGRSNRLQFIATTSPRNFHFNPTTRSTPRMYLVFSGLSRRIGHLSGGPHHLYAATCIRIEQAIFPIAFQPAMEGADLSYGGVVDILLALKDECSYGAQAKAAYVTAVGSCGDALTSGEESPQAIRAKSGPSNVFMVRRYRDQATAAPSRLVLNWRRNSNHP